ncbi:MAG: hypothetical protein A2049_08500 [Elusimicrobia bacterium GWA2_62_23]|nr:MAG: hypothetical protein A2049_08500 [Elusimicrobia bacterium GWA2_62_23]
MIERGLKVGGLTPAQMRAGGSLDEALGKFERFYVGAEFCENLLPGAEELKRTAGFFLGKGKKVSVVTPPLTERGLKNLRRVFKALRPLACQELELTVNDFGALELARELGLDLKVSAGRLMYENLFRIRASVFQVVNSYALHFFTARGVNRFEVSAVGARQLTNFGKAAALGFSLSEFSLTLYYPYLNLSSTRTCLLGTPEIGPQDSVTGIDCRRECRTASFEVAYPDVKEKLLVRGNTVFLHFPGKLYPAEKSLAARRVDRLVYCPLP